MKSGPNNDGIGGEGKLGSPLMVVGILFEMEGVTVETSGAGERGGKFEHIRDSAISVRVVASKSEYFVGRDSLKKGVFGGVVGYHLLLIDFQSDAKQHGKNRIWILSNSIPSYAGRDKILSLYVCWNADEAEHY